jgi:hypothetical protein
MGDLIKCNFPVSHNWCYELGIVMATNLEYLLRNGAEPVARVKWNGTHGSAAQIEIWYGREDLPLYCPLDKLF